MPSLVTLENQLSTAQAIACRRLGPTGFPRKRSSSRLRATMMPLRSNIPAIQSCDRLCSCSRPSRISGPIPIAKNRHPYREDRPGQDCSHNEIGDLRLASSNHSVVHFGICRARKRLPKWPVCAEELLSFGVVQYDGGSANLERCPHLAIESQKISLL